MSIANWSFAEAIAWLRTRGEGFSCSGASVELDVRPASVRLRVETRRRLGELTVWENGVAHMAVVELGSGAVVFERDGESLMGAPLEIALQGFFDRLG